MQRDCLLIYNKYVFETYYNVALFKFQREGNRRTAPRNSTKPDWTSTIKLSGLHLYKAWPYVPWLSSYITMQLVPEPQEMPACVLRLTWSVEQLWSISKSLQTLQYSCKSTSKSTTQHSGMRDWGKKAELVPLQDLPRILALQAGVKGMQKPLRNVHSYWVGSVEFSKSSNKLPSLFHYLPFHKIFMDYYYFWKASR